MKTRTEQIEDFLSGLNTEIDILNCIDVDEVNSFEDVRDQVEDNQGFDIDIIYYSTAMEYLTKNDTSLYESMEIAEEYGFTPKDLNSELLASLLASKLVREQFYELESEIEEFFNELGEEEDNENQAKYVTR